MTENTDGAEEKTYANKLEELFADVEAGAFGGYQLVEMVEQDGEDDPMIGLMAAAELQDYASSREWDFVSEAREQGRTWQEIARLLRVSKQTAWEKYSKEFA